jgi:hypothetical protein
VKRTLVSVATMIVATGFVVPGAFAGSPQSAKVLDRVDANASDIAKATKDGHRSARAAKSKRDFLADQARQGVLWDESEVESASVGPSTDVAYSKNVAVSRVQSALVQQPNGEVTSEIAATADVDDSTAAAGDAFRAGSDSLQNVSGQVSGSYSGGALTVQVSGDKLTSAWERYQVKEDKADRKIFYYGHWATAVGKVVDGGYDHNPGVIDIRSRPKVGRKDDFLNMRNYWPKESGAQCSDYSVGIGILGFSAQLPLGNCDGFTPDPDASNFLMKNVWSDGACRDGRAEYVDLGMAVDIKPSISTAVLSDYSYSRFEAAPCDQNADNDVRVIYADPGWS